MSSQNLLYTADPGLMLGFHGCEESVRDQIITGNSMLNLSRNKHDWLGAGYYFWQNNYERALDFASNPPGKKKFQKPAVLGAVLSLGTCLDLSDHKYIKLTKLSFDNLKKSTKKEGTKLPQNKNAGKSSDRVLRELDCAVIENIHKICEDLGEPPFDSVRGVFIEGKRLYLGAGFHEKTHVQICIRNPNCIKGFFLPRKEAQWPLTAGKTI